MSYSNGIIKSDTISGQKIGVSIDDLKRCFKMTLHPLGASSPVVSCGDLGAIIAKNTGDTFNGWTVRDREDINKWARYKPVVVPNEVKGISFAKRKEVKFGLTPIRCQAIENLLNTNPDSITKTLFNLAKNSAQEWTYTKPTGGWSAPFRITDFDDYDNRNRGVTGYKHSTPPPIDFGDSWGVPTSNGIITNVTTLYNVTEKMILTGESKYEGSASWNEYEIYDIVSGSFTDPTTIEIASNPRNIGLAYTSFKALFATNDDGSIRSSDNLNGIDNMAIPLNWLLGASLTQVGENWRMGLIVYVPEVGGGDLILPNPYVSLFVSKKPLHVKTNSMQESIGNYAIDMVTNQELAYKMKYYVEKTSNKQYDFDCIPVFIKGDTNTADVTITTPGKYGRSSIPLQSHLLIYSFPTGNKSFEISVFNREEGEDTKGWKLESIFNGTTIDLRTGGPVTSSTPSEARAQIRQLCITRDDASVRAYTYSIDVDCTYRSWNSDTGRAVTNYRSILRTGTIAAGLTFTINGSQKYGVAIDGGPELSISTIKKFEIKEA